MSDILKGATRAEFIEKLGNLNKRQIAVMMREQGLDAPEVRGSTAELLSACYDALQKATTAAGREASPSRPAPAAALRWEIRTRACTSRWRAGQHFTNVPQHFPADFFSGAELAELRADRYLQIRDLFKSE